MVCWNHNGLLESQWSAGITMVCWNHNGLLEFGLGRHIIGPVDLRWNWGQSHPADPVHLVSFISLKGVNVWYADPC